MSTKLFTEFLTIAAAGKTVDGRTITEEVLEIIAKTYDKDRYIAVINYEHYGHNYGTVEELRTIKQNGTTLLQGILQPNAEYLALNARKQKQFFSIEILPNFCDTNQPYLCGLAITDTPASVHTTKVEFSNNLSKTQKYCTDTVGSIINLTNQENLFNTIIHFFKNIIQPQESTNTMTQEQYNTLLQAIQTSRHDTNNKELSPPDSTSQEYTKLQSQITALEQENATLKQQNHSLSTPDTPTVIPASTGNITSNEDLY